MKKYIRLFRPKSALIYLFPLVLGLSAAIDDVHNGIARPLKDSILNGVKSLPPFIFAFIAFLCGSMFSSTLNFYADVHSDRLHDGLYKDEDISMQPFVTGEVSRREAFLIFAITGVGCAVFSFLVNPRFAAFMLGSVLVLGVLYSHPIFRMKERPVIDIFLNSTGAVLLLIAGASVVTPEFPPVLPMVFGFILGAVLYIPSMVNDVPFDEKAGFRTSGVVFGQKAMLHAMAVLSAMLVPLGIFVILSGKINWQYKLFDGLAMGGALVATIHVLTRFRPPHIEINPLLLIVPLSLALLFYFAVIAYRLCAG